MYYRSVLLLVVLALAPSLSFSSDNGHEFFSAYYGAASFSGDLSKDQRAQYWALAFNIVTPPVQPESKFAQWMGGLSGILTIDFSHILTKNSGNDFPFSIDRSISLSTSSVLPGVCFLAHNPANICFGMGVGLVSVYEGSRNFQEYGSVIYSLLATYRAMSRLELSFESKSFGLEQTVNDARSSFNFTTYALGAGWSFF